VFQFVYEIEQGNVVNGPTDDGKANANVGLEIFARLVKVFQGFLTLLVWFTYALGGYSVYLLITVSSRERYASDAAWGYVFGGWCALAAIVFLRLVQMAIGWAIYLPIEARIRGINVRDPVVVAEVRGNYLGMLISEGAGLLVCLAIPLIIFYIRFGRF
jgi:hypothetical protein